MTDDNATDELITIRLTKRNGKTLTILLSPDDADLQQYTWSTVGGKHAYPVRSVKGDNKKKIYLAREVMAAKEDRDLGDNEIVQYIDGNRLNCQRENLYLKTSNRRYTRKL